MKINNLKPIISNLGLQIRTGVMEIAFGLMFITFPLVKLLHLPSILINLLTIVFLIIIYLLNNSLVYPRVLKNPDLNRTNKAEVGIMNSIILIAIVAGLVMLYLVLKGYNLNMRYILFSCGLYTGLSINTVSIVNKVSRLMLYGQLVILLSMLFITKCVTSTIQFSMLAFFGIIMLLFGLINLKKFTKANPMNT